MMNKCAKFHKDSPSGKKLNSISGERLNFRRRPILCTTSYRNLTQASNFGGTFDQLLLWIFLWKFHRRCLSTSSIPWCKKVKNDQKLKSRGSCLNGMAKAIESRNTQWFLSWRSFVENSICTWRLRPSSAFYFWFWFVLQWSFSCNLPSGGGVAMVSTRLNPKDNSPNALLSFLEKNQYDNKRWNYTCHNVGVCC